MSTKSVSRRDILKSLTMGAMASSVLRVIPLHAAEYAHHMVAAERAAAAAGAYSEIGRASCRERVSLTV